MYNAETLKEGLLGLVGWRQNPDPSGEQLLGLTTSESGIYFNDQHALLTFDNLLSLAPELSGISYAAWNAGTTYAKGELVSQGGNSYRSLQAGNTNNTPGASPAYWVETTPFTEWLRLKTEAGIIGAVEDWINAKFEVKTARNLLEQETVFEGANAFDTQPNGGTVVGLTLAPARSKSIKVDLQEIGLQLEQNQSITLYLFKSGEKTAIASETIAYTGGGSLQWFATSAFADAWELSGEGAYYIAYNEAALAGNAINGVRDYLPYLRADTLIEDVYFPCPRFYQLAAFSNPATSVAELWDIKTNRHTTGTNYGLNLRLSVRCDYTGFVLDQKTLFKSIIAKRVAIELLRQMAFNPEVRINRHERNANPTAILYEIDGDSQGRPGGLKREYYKALGAVTFDTTGIDPICLPCRKRGVKYRTI